MSLGDLVVIDSEAEWKFVLEALKSKGEEDELWMGASASKGADGEDLGANWVRGPLRLVRLWTGWF